MTDLRDTPPLEEDGRRCDPNTLGLWAVEHSSQRPHSPQKGLLFLPHACRGAPAIGNMPPAPPAIVLGKPSALPPVGFSGEGRVAVAWVRLLDHPTHELVGPFAFANLASLEAWLFVAEWVSLQGYEPDRVTNVGFLSAEPRGMRRPHQGPSALPTPVGLSALAQPEPHWLRANVYIKLTAGGFRVQAFLCTDWLYEWKRSRTALACATISDAIFAHPPVPWQWRIHGPEPGWGLMDMYGFVLSLDCTHSADRSKMIAWCCAWAYCLPFPKNAVEHLKTMRSEVWKKYKGIALRLGREMFAEEWLGPEGRNRLEAPPDRTKPPELEVLGDQAWSLFSPILLHPSEPAAWLLAQVPAPSRVKWGTGRFASHERVAAFPREYLFPGEQGRALSEPESEASTNSKRQRTEEVPSREPSEDRRRVDGEVIDLSEGGD